MMPDTRTPSDSVADDMIRSYFERWRRLEAEKDAISADLRELFAEMKGDGFDTKVARKVFRDKEADPNDRAEFEAVYDLYMAALSGPRAGRAREGVAGGAEEITTKAPSTGDFNLAGAHEEFDAETGEIIEPQPQPAAQSQSGRPAGAAMPVESVGDEISAPNSNSVSTEPPSPLTEGEGGGSALLENSAEPGEVRYEKCPQSGMVRHAFQRCFPECWGPAIADLADDIRQNGIRNPIVMLDGQVLDGWARYIVARNSNLEYPVTEYAGTDPLADVIRWNLESRNLIPEQRKSIASKLMKLPEVADRADEILALFGLETEAA